VSQTPARGRHRAPSVARRRLGRAVLASLTAGAPVAALGIGVAPAAHAETDWDALAKCESGGDWGINTGNGFGGGLQFTDSTWKAFGGSGQPEDASREQQIVVAEKVKASQGMNAWPTCSKKTGQTSNEANSGSSGSSSSGSASSDDEDQQQAPAKKKAPAKPKSTTVPQETKAAKASTASAPSAPSAPSGGTYTVAAGDTLSSIAARQGTTWAALQQANTDVVTDPNMILPGWTLKTG
jgi:resuscitation-promoting factor RpfA